MAANTKQVPLSVFLETYKTLENALREATELSNLSWSSGCITPGTVAELEDGTTNDEYKNKLRVCRNIRNYAQHNQGAENFVIVSQAMLEFLKERTRDIQILGGTVKDIMTRYSAKITPKSTLAETAGVIAKAKKEWYPVVDENGMFYSVLEKDDILKALAGGATPKTRIAKIMPDKTALTIKTAVQTTPIAELGAAFDEKIIVTTQTGKVAGFV